MGNADLIYLCKQWLAACEAAKQAREQAKQAEADAEEHGQLMKKWEALLFTHLCDADGNPTDEVAVLLNDQTFLRLTRTLDRTVIVRRVTNVVCEECGPWIVR